MHNLDEQRRLPAQDGEQRAVRDEEGPHLLGRL